MKKRVTRVEVLPVVAVLVEPRMPTAMQAAMSRANSAVDRVWPACVELDKKSHVVGVRNAGINRALSKRWAQGTIYVKVIEVSQAQRAKGLSMNPTVTVSFSQSKNKIEKMSVNNYLKEGITSADLDEKQLSALGLYWNEGRYWTKEEEEAEELLSEEEYESDDLPELEEVDSLGTKAKGSYAAAVAGQAERAAVTAAMEARVAIEATAQLEAAEAAAKLASGGVDAAHLARQVAEIEAATAAQVARESLLAAAENEAAAEASAAEAVAASVAARMAADDAMARATPTPKRPTTMRVTPEGVSHAVTRSGAAKSAALEARAPSLAREAAAAAKAAANAAATIAAVELDELVIAALEVGCSMARAGLRKLAAMGCGADEFRALGDLGEAGFVAVLADTNEAGYHFTELEKVLLKKHMVPEVEAPMMGGSNGSGRVIEIDIDEVASVASTMSEVEEPAPPQAARVVAPAAVAVSRPASRVRELVSLLRPSEASKLIEFTKDAVLEALLERAPRKVELQRPEAALELWLEKELGLSVEACKTAASCDLDAMEAWMLSLVYKVESERRGIKNGGSSGGGGGAAADGGGEAATFAAMIAAGGVSSTADPALLEALKEAALDPSVKVKLEGVKKLFSEGKPVEAAALLSALNEKPCMAAVYYKAGEVKHVQGSSVIPGANAVVVLVGAVRESVDIWTWRGRCRGCCLRRATPGSWRGS